jgi:SAM-dependent methyltransferase
MTGGQDLHHPLFARLYSRMSRGMEAAGLAPHRRRLLDGLAGAVVEIGAGNGMNFAHYPAAVTRVVAVEPEPYLREQAARAAVDAPVPVEVVPGLAGALPLEEGEVDAAVFSLVLCSVDDQDAALADARRVLRAGGEVRFFEHVAARTRPLHRFQRGVDVVWPHLAGGCRTSRRTVSAIERAGFTITEYERFRFPETRLPIPTAPHVLGRALRP